MTQVYNDLGTGSPAFSECCFALEEHFKFTATCSPQPTSSGIQIPPSSSGSLLLHQPNFALHLPLTPKPLRLRSFAHCAINWRRYPIPARVFPILPAFTHKSPPSYAAPQIKLINSGVNTAESTPKMACDVRPFSNTLSSYWCSLTRHSRTTVISIHYSASPFSSGMTPHTRIYSSTLRTNPNE